MEKLKAGIFDGPHIRKLNMDSYEASAWCSFALVVQNVLGNNKSENYEELVQNMLTNFRNY